MAARSFLYGGGGASSSLLDPVDSFFVSRSSSFKGTRSMVSFEDKGNNGNFQLFDHEDNNGDDEYDEYFQQPEKKRRLTADQVRFLERSFEEDNKLEPERKIQLAKELGLQPRQVAIWFQNRRARWKNKQLEKDYDDLQESYDKLKANYENLVKENEKLKSEVLELTDKLMIQEKGTSDSSTSKSQQQILEDVSKNTNTGYGQDGNFTVKSVEFDNEVHTSLIERVDSSYVFEQEQSDGYSSPKIENGDYTGPHSENSYYLGLNRDDQGFGFWSY